MAEYRILILILCALLLVTILAVITAIRKSAKVRKLEIEQAQDKVRLAEGEKIITELKERTLALNNDNFRLSAENTKIKSDNENQKIYLEDKLAYLEKSKEEMAERFKNVSNEVIQTQQRRFNEEQKNVLNVMLEPFKQQIADFRAKVESVHDDSMKNKISFDAQLKNLFSLNQSLSKDAQDLSMALKGGKKLQGNWGEFQLERVLEISGLQKGVNYFTQETFKNEENRMLRPDVVVCLPNERSVIIDSKVSLNDYMAYVNSEDENTRAELLKKHIQCIRSHIDELSTKEYQKLLKNSSLDYVVIFIPIESAYVEAVKADSSLYDYSYRKNIAITTPSSLLPILRTVENLWRIENQNKYVSQIATVGGLLYDKLANFVDDMQRIDKSIDTARKNYDLAISKLSTGKGNALSLAARLKDYGAKASKTLSLDYEDQESTISEQIQLTDEAAND